MKLRIIPINILIILFSISLNGQDTLKYSEKAYALKTDILLPSITIINQKNVLWFTLTGEKYLTAKRSFQLSASYLNWQESNYLAQSWQIIPQYKFFIFNKKPHRGFYLGPYLKYEFAYSQIFSYQYYYHYGNLVNQEKIIDREDFYHFLAAGSSMGYQLIIKNRFSLDFLFQAGILKYIYTVTKQYSENYKRQNNIKYKLDALALLNVGYCFGKKEK